MKRLVFVHGMSQEGKDPTNLKSEWEDALEAAWAKNKINTPQYQLEMPYYGDELDKLQKAIAAGGDVKSKGGAAADKTEVAIYRALQKRAGISDDDLREEADQEVVQKGPANWEWVQAMGRILQKKAPWLGEAGLKLSLVKQVAAYISRPHIQKAIDEIVSPAFTGESVIVSHSLGTIVSYHLLTFNQNSAKVPLYATLGSPLGIDVVKSYLRPPNLSVPSCVNKWINGSDERDFVALESQLTKSIFCEGIENFSDIKNRKDDPHSIGDYLSDSRVCRMIAEALN